MKKLFLIAAFFLGAAQNMSAQNLISNGDFSSYSCSAPSCNITSFINYPSPSNVTDWYALSLSPEIYTGVVGAFMWGGTASDQEAIIQVLATPPMVDSSYSFSVDAFHNDNRGSGGIIILLEDDSGNSHVILSTAITNTTPQTYTATVTPTQSFTRIIIRPYAASGYMDLVVDNVKLERSIASGLKTKENPGLIQVYPNPINDRFNISYQEAGPVQVQIYNVAGKEMYSEVIETPDHKSQIDVAGWQSGVYILQLRSLSGEVRELVKLIKV